MMYDMQFTNTFISTLRKILCMRRQVLDWKDIYQTLTCANILRYVFGQNIILHVYIRIIC